MILRQFVKVWKEFYGKTDDLFKNLLCPRNITLMAQPCTDQVVWTNMARLVSLLVKTNLLSCDNFEVQCTSFYQKDWDKVILSILKTFCYINVKIKIIFLLRIIIVGDIFNVYEKLTTAKLPEPFFKYRFKTLNILFINHLKKQLCNIG